MLFTDTSELKKILDIDPLDLSEDAKLSLCIEWATDLIGTFLGRPGFDLKARTEFYKGTGTQNLLLNHRPVSTTPTIVVLSDTAGNYGSSPNAFDSSIASLVYGTDFCLDIDQEDGTSRSGILVRIGDYWPRPRVRSAGLLSPFLGQDTGSLKITYTAGYTVDNLPAAFRVAGNLLVARLRYIFPLGMELGGEGYEERSLAVITDQKDYIFSLIRPILSPYRNWRW